jgi:NTP pyrophosphatase (non-canonical NTP hydrolase)
VTDLPAAAVDIVNHLRQHFPADQEKPRQVLALAEEVGEFVGAARRHLGMARRTGTFDDMAAELADVVITAYVTANVLGIDLDSEITAKLDVVFARGWKDQA